jgi:hypothetical protein
MKKVTILAIVLVLLVVSVVPVMAKGPKHGQGNGSTPGQGNSTGVNPGDRIQERQQNQDRGAKISTSGNGNHGQTRMRTSFYLQGVISAVDIGAKTIKVTLIHGNAQVKQYIGFELTLQANDTTQIFKVTQVGEEESESDWSTTPTRSSDESEQSTTPTRSNEETDTGRVPITFDKLAAGQKVAIHGDLVNSVYTVRLITVYIQMTVGEQP